MFRCASRMRTNLRPLIIAASLTRSGARVSIDFCPSMRNGSSQLAYNYRTSQDATQRRCTGAWAQKWSILAAGTCRSSTRPAAGWSRNTRPCAVRWEFSTSATWAIFGFAPGGLRAARLAAVQHLSMNDASQLAIGQAHYSALLYPQRHVCRRRDRAPTWAKTIFCWSSTRGPAKRTSAGFAKIRKGFDCVVEDLSDALYAAGDSGTSRDRRDAEVDRRESRRRQELLVHARHRLRAEEYL